MAGGDIFEFARTARPGEAMEYGRGDHPPRDVVRAMRGLVDAGVLRPVTRRIGGREGGGFQFLVQKGAGGDGPVARAARRGAVRRRRVRKTSLSMVFDCLARAARRGEACPTNEELARHCGLSGKLAASYRVRRLVAEGRIAVEDRSPFGRRIVTILTGPHTGARTSEAPV